MADKSNQDSTRRVSHRLRRILAVTVIAASLATAFGIGWMVSPEGSVPSDATSQPAAEESATAQEQEAEDAGSTNRHPTATSAALAAAQHDNPELSDASVTRIVGIFAGDTTIDLRVQVSANSFCHWYGVVGTLNQDRIAWQGASAPDEAAACQN